MVLHRFYNNKFVLITMILLIFTSCSSGEEDLVIEEVQVAVEETTTTTTAGVTQPDNPGDTKNCGDFETYDEAKAWFDTYYEYYGDVARLDRDGDLEPCESLPGGP